MRFSILFVCTGNICRSPTAHAVLRHRLSLAGLEGRVHVDSAGTHGYHVGEAPDPRTIKAAADRGYAMGDLRARKVSAQDFSRFDLILAMDSGHRQGLLLSAPQAARPHIGLFLPYAGVTHTSEVPDPYYGNHKGFEHVLDLVEEAAELLIGQLRKE